MAVRNEFCHQIVSLEEVNKEFGHDLYKKDRLMFILIEEKKNFVRALDAILDE